MKKGYVLSFILGIIVMAGIVGVYAINANEIDYRDTKVDQALDTLYQRSTYTEYSGSTEVTPSSTSQILSTNNKLLKSNITINAIASTFKELSTTTTVTANNLLSGETAYNNLGELITGNVNTNCVSGTIQCTGTADDLIEISSFNPTILQLYWPTGTDGKNISIYFNRNISDQAFRTFYRTSNSSWTNGPNPITQYFEYNSTTNKFYFKNWQLTRNSTGYYTVCR